MTTNKSFLRKALAAAVFGALVLPVSSLASPVSAATPTIEKPWSTTFLVGGSAPVKGLSTKGWGNKTVLVAVGAVATGSASAKAFLRVDNFDIITTPSAGWEYKSDVATQKASNNGAGLETLQFYGPEAIVNEMLARLIVTTTAGTTKVEIKTMATEYKKGLLYYMRTEHFYRLVIPIRENAQANSVGTAATQIVDTSFTWMQAKAAAEASTELGQKGYLATITSVEENEYVTSRISPDGVGAARNIWLGGVNTDTNYEWKWAGGPEKDVVFYKGCETSNTRAGTSPTYHGFSDGEPNNFGFGNPNCSTTELRESCLLTNNKDANVLGEWNDFPCELTRYPGFGASESQGYVIEYGNKPIGGEFKGVVTSSSKLTRAVPPARPALVQRLARQIGKFKTNVLSFGKKKRAKSEVRLQVLEKGDYLIRVLNCDKREYRCSGLRLRDGSAINGQKFNLNPQIADSLGSFTLKKDARSVTFTLVTYSGKKYVDKPVVRLYRVIQNTDGTKFYLWQDVPSNWKLALK